MANRHHECTCQECKAKRKRTLKQGRGTWTDARGNTHRITEMSDRYVRNCIGWQQRKKAAMEAVEYECAQVDHEVDDIDQSIMEFCTELNWRDETGNNIADGEGCERVGAAYG